jgi:hypothetical protein
MEIGRAWWRWVVVVVAAVVQERYKGVTRVLHKLCVCAYQARLREVLRHKRPFCIPHPIQCITKRTSVEPKQNKRKHKKRAARFELAVGLPSLPVLSSEAQEAVPRTPHLAGYTWD